MFQYQTKVAGFEIDRMTFELISRIYKSEYVYMKKSAQNASSLHLYM